MPLNELIDRILANLTPNLLKAAYRNKLKGDSHFTTGHCYVASEVLYHIYGKDNGFVPYNIKHEGESHWYLMNGKGNVIDITKDQFKTPVSYYRGKRQAFLTKEPSKRCLLLMKLAEVV